MRADAPVYVFAQEQHDGPHVVVIVAVVVLVNPGQELIVLAREDCTPASGVTSGVIAAPFSGSTFGMVTLSPESTLKWFFTVTSPSVAVHAHYPGRDRCAP